MPDLIPDLMPIVIGVFFFVIGGVFVVVGIRGLREAKRFRAVAVRGQALVIDLRYRRGSGSSSRSSSGTYHPVFRFTLPDGRVVEAEGMTGSSPAPASRGDIVEVLYDPKQPIKVTLANELLGGGCLWVVLMLFGLPFVLVGTISVIITSGLLSR